MDKDTIAILIEKQEKICRVDEDLYNAKVNEINAELQGVIMAVANQLVGVRFNTSNTCFMVEREPGNSWTLDVTLTHDDRYKTYEKDEVPELEVKMDWSGRNVKLENINELKYGALCGKLCEDLMGEQVVLKACLEAKSDLKAWIENQKIRKNREILSQLRKQQEEMLSKEATQYAMGFIKLNAEFVTLKKWQRGRSFSIHKGTRVKITKLGRKNVVVHKGYRKDFGDGNVEWQYSAASTYMSIEAFSFYIEDNFITAV